MPSKLSVKDYEMIIKHYGKRVPKTARKKKQKAEDLIALKLCSCIKKVTRKSRAKNEARSIGICSVSVIKNRGMKYKNFTCKKPRRIKNLKKTRNIKFKHPYRKSRKKKSLKGGHLINKYIND